MKALFPLLMIFFSLFCNGQSYPPDYGEMTNIFIYGDSVTDSDKNFENFFRNFPLFVTNAEQFDLLSYECIGTIKNEKQAGKYVKKNFKVLEGWSIRTSYHQSLTIRDSIQTREFPGKNGNSFHKDPSVKTKKSGNQNKIATTFAKNYLSAGDKIYEVRFIFNLREYSVYMFVNAKTNQVIKKGNIFMVEMPLEAL